MRWCTPGVLETMASCLRVVMRLMRELLPTFERPIIANSGYFGGGHVASVTQDCMYSDCVILWLSAGSIISARLVSTIMLPCMSSSFIPVGVGTLRILFTGAFGSTLGRLSTSSALSSSSSSSSSSVSSDDAEGLASAPPAGPLPVPAAAASSPSSSPPEVDAPEAAEAEAAAPFRPNADETSEAAKKERLLGWSRCSLICLRGLALQSPAAPGAARAQVLV